MATHDYTTEELDAFLTGWDTECFILGNEAAQYTLLVNVEIFQLEQFAAGCDAAASTCDDIIEGEVLE